MYRNGETHWVVRLETHFWEASGGILIVFHTFWGIFFECGVISGDFDRIDS